MNGSGACLTRPRSMGYKERKILTGQALAR